MDRRELAVLLAFGVAIAVSGLLADRLTHYGFAWNWNDGGAAQPPELRERMEHPRWTDEPPSGVRR